eukprot:jgi/Botrbrau1/11614/Bobra.0209s0005.1
MGAASQNDTWSQTVMVVGGNLYRLSYILKVQFTPNYWRTSVTNTGFMKTLLELNNVDTLSTGQIFSHNFQVPAGANRLTISFTNSNFAGFWYLTRPTLTLVGPGMPPSPPPPPPPPPLQRICDELDSGFQFESSSPPYGCFKCVGECNANYTYFNSTSGTATMGAASQNDTWSQTVRVVGGNFYYLLYILKVQFTPNYWRTSVTSTGFMKTLLELKNVDTLSTGQIFSHNFQVPAGVNRLTISFTNSNFDGFWYLTRPTLILIGPGIPPSPHAPRHPPPPAKLPPARPPPSPPLKRSPPPPPLQRSCDVLDSGFQFESSSPPYGCFKCVGECNANYTYFNSTSGTATMGAVSQNDTWSQTVRVIGGSFYRLSYLLQVQSTPNYWRTSVNSTGFMKALLELNNDVTLSTGQTFSHNFQVPAAANRLTISFTNSNIDGFWYLTRPTLFPAPVPASTMPVPQTATMTPP